MSNENKVVLVTGGTGLVGTAIKYIVEEHETKNENETFIFMSSKDVDLTYVMFDIIHFFIAFISVFLFFN